MHKGSKIVFVMLWHVSERTGGAEVQANYLAQELVQRGYSISYVCQTLNSNKINTKEMILGLEVYWVKPVKVFIWTGIKRYFSVLKTLNPDIIIQRNSSPVLFASGWYKKRYQVKFIWICTDNLAPDKTFFLQKFKKKSSIKSMGFLKYIVFYLNNRFNDVLRNLAMKSVDVGFSQNTFQKDKIKENFGLDTFNMISGHPLPSNQISIFKRFNNQKILWCANLGQHKRPELFIDLATKMQHTNYKFIMVGGHSDNNYVAQLLANKPDNLIITGQLNFEDALCYFKDATVLVNTSISEGFSNTYIQSWLRGVPTVVFGADPSNVITDNNLGYSIGKVSEASHKITELFSDEELYIKLSKNVYDYAMNQHTIKVMTDHFINTLSKNL
jgi:glycosyltransferase involved in cell wall biosynthesis